MLLSMVSMRGQEAFPCRDPSILFTLAGFIPEITPYVRTLTPNIIHKTKEM